jgi:4-alpha-glucanotransferase
MTELDAQLAQLAARHGVATEYWDWQGQPVQVPAETLIAVLHALGVPAATTEQRDNALHEHEKAHWARSLPPVVIARTGRPTSFWVHVTHGDPVEAWIELERGGVRTGLSHLENSTPPYDLDGRYIGEASFEIPSDIALGYHQLAIRAGDYETRTLLIVTPSWLGFPERMGDRREWGLATQLYSVRSTGSWGVGDLTDLTDLAVWAGAEHGAGFVLVNPLHAAEPITPMEPSPYLPSSRRFANPIYLRPERIPEYAEVPHREAIVKLRTELQTAIEEVDAIDRDSAWVAKRAALEQVYEVPRSDGRDYAYAAYRRREGRGLDDFAAWCALVEVHGPDWHQWPAELQHPASAGVTAFVEAHEPQVDFHRWLQWQLDEQLAATQSASQRAGMALGVVHDLAVGVHPNGADVWALQDALAKGINAGAPPDAFNQTGQNWSQPPWRPDQLAELAYAPFRALVSAVLRHAGGVRIDHIIGLFRLWWIPEGAPPTEGTYVRYDHEAMIGIVALEAYRSRALVVGEDLGVVEPWVRSYLEERGILGTSILWFEFDYQAGGAPLPAERWREYCLSSVTTHDLPPTAGYLAGDHVRLRESLGLLTRSLDEELAVDRAEQGSWLAELQRRGLLADVPDGEDVTDTVIALHRYLTQTPSRLLSLSLTDAVGDRRTQNQPGTLDEYPNWRVPLTGPDGRPMLLEEVFISPRVAALAETLRPPANG